ncbi:MAG TPA: MOSC N-terminal beta barrel domain-containing protein [Terriglobales bacterium]|nr:MOSC N-terminal beta barrel domain-containing protein [Terriglobales bacterium]
MTPTPGQAASIVSIWRYPVKSMMGEELNASEISKDGLAGDRAFALIDSSDEKIATAKNPKKWPHLFDFRAALVQELETRTTAVRITLPDGTIVYSSDADVHRLLSDVLQRAVTLRARTQTDRPAAMAASAGASAGTAEEYWPDLEGLDHRDTVTEFGLPEGSFFDAASVHVLTTATLDRLRMLYPQGRFETRRFRPNLVVRTDGQDGFVENEWVGRVLAIGDSVRLSITAPCLRCVMTTLPQGDLPNDNGILRTAAQHNRASVGVYASVLQGGTVRRGDPVRLE